MNLDCARCGAHLELEEDRESAECPYCGATKFIDRDGDGKASIADPDRSPDRKDRSGAIPVIATLVFLGVLGVGFFALYGDDGQDGEEAALQTRERAAAQKKAAEESAPKQLEEPPASVLSRKQAKKVLKPEILACMKQHKVHYLITRIGQGYDAPRGLYPPLTIVHGSVVDYRDVDGADFNKSPLGLCILEAASKIWADAPRGAYVHFGLRNPHAVDPLAGKPRRLNTAKAKRALAELDDAARECGRRQLEGFRPGRDLSMLVKFRGIDGQVSDVDPNYIPRDSPYGKCIRETYSQATAPRFRDLSAKVLHKLRF